MNAARLTCTHTISVGSFVLYWMSPIAPWVAMRQHSSVIERSVRLVPRRRTRIQTMTAAKPRSVARRPCWWTTQSSVFGPRHSRRSMTSPVPAPPACGPRRGRGGAQEDGRGAERDERAHRPDREAVRRPRAAAGLVARAPEQRDGGGEEEHREDVVAHDEPGREVVLDGVAAEDRLPDDAERQQQPDRRQVAPVGTPAERERGRRPPR